MTIAACGRAGQSIGDAGDGGADDRWGDRTPQFFNQNVPNAVDVVFMMDNSPSAGLWRINFLKGFPTFMNVLKSFPAGLPDLHMGVLSSSLGAGRFSNVPGCPTDGDRGAFQHAARGGGGTCTAVPKDGYIISLEKGTKNNFTGDISDVISCIADLGTEGCDFEHQLASVARALGGNLGGWSLGAPPENTGFLRDDALLAVLIVTGRDDCSAPVDSDLFDPGQTSLSDPYGPLSTFRCYEFGDLCSGMRPPRTPASLTDCHSAEDGRLIRIADFASFFQTIKKLPGEVLVSAIAAPPAPFSVALNAAGQPEVAPSCASMNGQAWPAVRLKQFIDQFGNNGTFDSICADAFAPALDHAAAAIGKILGAQCIDGLIADTDPVAAGVQPSCDVFDQTRTASGNVSTPIPSCDGGTPPCWRLVPNNRDCTISGYEVKIDRGGTPAPANTATGICCETCKDPSDPHCAR